MESLEKRIPNLDKRSRQNDKEAKLTLELVQKILPLLAEGKPAVVYKPKDAEEEKYYQMLQLMTTKQAMYVCNMNEDEVSSGNDHSKKVEEMAKAKNSPSARICARIEEEIATLASDEEKKEFMESLGYSETGLSKIIKLGYKQLGLATFFTIGPKEAHAWTVKQNSSAPQAAGVIHTDFEKGFISAETIKTEDYIALNGETGCKEKGKMAVNGKEYVVKDGDIFHFRFNV